MPLVNRLGVDTISSFQRAAPERFTEAELLGGHHNPLAAIYLYGYSIEMIIKAAYFRTRGHTATQEITDADRRAALGGDNPHNFVRWAELLVALNNRLPRPTYDQAFGIELVNHALLAYQNWRPGMRYCAMIPHEHEVETVRASACWFARDEFRM